MPALIESHQELLRFHGLSDQSTVLILSSSMTILYASPQSQSVLLELKGDVLCPTAEIPPAVLAYIGEGIMKHIQLQRVLADFSPVRSECSIESAHRRWHCSGIGLPSPEGIDHSRIILVLFESRDMTVSMTTVRQSLPRVSLLWQALNA